MEGQLDPELLLATHCNDIDGDQYVYVELLQALGAKKIKNPSRDIGKVVTTMLLGTTVKLSDVLLKHAGRVVLLRHIMQLLIVRGMAELPWTVARRHYVQHFYGDALIPDTTTMVQSHMVNATIILQYLILYYNICDIQNFMIIVRSYYSI
jgi:hypothetical protein